MQEKIKIYFSMLHRYSDAEVDSSDDGKSFNASEFLLDERIVLHDDLIEDTGEMFESYRDHIKLPVDFKNIMFREFFTIGKNPSVWKECSKMHTCNIPCDDVGSGSITMKKIEGDQILIMMIQRLTIDGVQQIMEVLTVIDENFQLVREDIIERVVSPESGVEVQ